MLINKQFLTRIKIIFFIGLFWSSLAVHADSYCGNQSIKKSVRGDWLHGSWGIRVVLPGGNRMSLVSSFMKGGIVDQLAELKTPGWVMINLSEPSFSGMFTSTYPELNKNVSTLMSANVDLLSHYIKELRKKNYKIVLYFAGQGPSLDFLSSKKRKSLASRRPDFYQKISEIDERWQRYLKRKKLSNEQATAEIIRYFSRKFGNQVDGWWFDHGKWADSRLLISAARSGNADAVVAWNSHHKIGYGGIHTTPGIVWMLTQSAVDADYTDGHVTPTKLKLPWWDGNEKLIEQMEACTNIGGLQPHLFIPLQSNWRGGKEVFPEKKAIDWSNRVIDSGGAITWAAALQPPEFKTPLIWDKSFNRLKAIDQAFLSKNKLPALRKKIN